MKKIKILILLVVLFILSGCSAQYEINFASDGTITENLSLNVKNDDLNYYESNSVISYLNSYLDSYDNVLKFGGYDYNISSKKNNSIIKFDRKVDKLCEVIIKNPFYKYIYKDISCKEDKYYYTIENSSKLIMNEAYEGKEFNIKSLNLKLTLPVNAEENNADEVDGTTYIWKYDENTKDKDFYIKISKVSLEENKRLLEEQEKSSKLKNKIITISTVIIILLALGIISLVFYKKYKRNKIDYK